MKKFLDLHGLETLLLLLRDKCASRVAVDKVAQDANLYILDVDYSLIEFDTSEIVQ